MARVGKGKECLVTIDVAGVLGEIYIYLLCWSHDPYRFKRDIEELHVDVLYRHKRTSRTTRLQITAVVVQTVVCLFLVTFDMTSHS